MSVHSVLRCSSRSCCCCWASNFCAWHVAICVNFSFKAQEQLFEQTFCHLIFPVRGKLIVDSLWKSSSPVSTSEIEFTSCRSRRGKPSSTQRLCLVVHKEWQPDVAGRIGKKMSDWSLLFSSVSADSSSSTDGTKTRSVHRCTSHEIDTSTQLLLVSFLSLTHSLSLSLSWNILFLCSSPSLPFHFVALRVRHCRELSVPELASLPQRRCHLGTAGDACRLTWYRSVAPRYACGR